MPVLACTRGGLVVMVVCMYGGNLASGKVDFNFPGNKKIKKSVSCLIGDSITAGNNWRYAIVLNNLIM